MNKVFLIGRMTKDPQLKRKEDTTSTSFDVAVNEVIKKEGKPEQTAIFIKVLCFDKTADNVCKYCHKGSNLAVEGKLTTYTFTDDKGSTHFMTYVMANQITFLDTKEAKKEESPSKDEAPF